MAPPSALSYRVHTTCCARARRRGGEGDATASVALHVLLDCV